MSPENISQKVVCKYENFGFCMMREECENFQNEKIPSLEQKLSSYLKDMIVCDDKKIFCQI